MLESSICNLRAYEINANLPHKNDIHPCTGKAYYNIATLTSAGAVDSLINDLFIRVLDPEIHDHALDFESARVAELADALDLGSDKANFEAQAKPPILKIYSFISGALSLSTSQLESGIIRWNGRLTGTIWAQFRIGDYTYKDAKLWR